MSTITSDTLLLHTDRHARVTAGPGAGKTYWLAEHTKNVIKRSSKLHSHARIAIISYTNIAAEELRQKIGNSSERAFTGTIHSFLYLNVVKPYVHLIRSANAQPLVNVLQMDGHDEHHVNHRHVDSWLRQINQRHRVFDADQFTRLKTALEFIRWAQADAIDDWYLDVAVPGWLEPQLWNPTREVLTHQHLLVYKALYWAEGTLDHDDVLYFATRILHEFPVVATCLSARYPFLFIDEFQDTVPAQTNIVRTLVAEGTTAAVIGDAEQSIFTFAGARPEHFRLFTLNDLDEYTIEDNRRSTDRIINLLNHVRTDGITQHGLRQEQGDPVRLIVGTTAATALHARTFIGDDKVPLIVGRTRNIVEEAQQPDTAPVARPWDSLENADNDRKIFLHQLFAGILLARQRRYDTAVRSILRGIRHADGRLKEPLRCTSPLSAQHRRAVAINLLEAFAALGPTLDTMTLRAAYDHCGTELNAAFPSISLKQNLRGAFFTVSERYNCGTLLQSVKLTNTDEVRDARTIHQAKGTERHNVVVCLKGRDAGETQTHLNHILHPAHPSDEQQRVTYVAISRARDRLFLTAPDLTEEQEQRANELGISVIRLPA
ncbi:MAG: ATP-dependent helicase [Terracidiphilus sp.]|jgi:DNA helicase-2/ATP-dependent DNA helicase PcrA